MKPRIYWAIWHTKLYLGSEVAQSTKHPPVDRLVIFSCNKIEPNVPNADFKRYFCCVEMGWDPWFRQNGVFQIELSWFDWDFTHTIKDSIIRSFNSLETQFWNFKEQKITKKEILTLIIDLKYFGIRLICIVTKIHISIFGCIFVAAMQCSHEIICWFVIFIKAIQSTTLNHFISM